MRTRRQEMILAVEAVLLEWRGAHEPLMSAGVRRTIAGQIVDRIRVTVEVQGQRSKVQGRQGGAR